MRRKIPDTHRQFARAMRNEPTEAEAAPWGLLKSRKLGGMRYRRQHPIGSYIVDFICLEARLVMEVDGSQHADSARDKKRDEDLRARGFQVLRFWNNEVLNNADGVAETVLAAVQKRQQ